jgi:hypothetical protein
MPLIILKIFVVLSLMLRVAMIIIHSDSNAMAIINFVCTIAGYIVATVCAESVYMSMRKLPSADKPEHHNAFVVLCLMLVFSVMGVDMYKNAYEMVLKEVQVCKE